MLFNTARSGGFPKRLATKTGAILQVVVVVADAAGFSVFLVG